MSRTRGPWSQGEVLLNGMTKYWPAEKMEEEQRKEKRLVFANFTDRKKGKGRILVAACIHEDDAKHIAECVMACAALNDQDVNGVANKHSQRILDRALKAEKRCDELLAALTLARNMFVANGLDISMPNTFETMQDVIAKVQS